MSKTLAIGFAVGLVCLGIAIAAVFHMQRGAHIELEGKFLKVRTATIDEGASIAVVDFRITNPADYAFVGDHLSLVLEDKSGKQTEGQMIPEIDAKRVFEAVPLLGEKFNASLITKEPVPAHGTMDRMLMARFVLPESALQGRKRFILRMEEVSGATTVEIPEM